jgi:hypothetical protein
MKIYKFLLAALLALTVVLILAAPASAAIGTPQWSGQRFSGTDAFYGNVVAYTVGDTAKITVPVTNDTGVDIDIKGAKIAVMGLGEYTTDDRPSSIPAGKTDFVRFEFTIPAPAEGTMASYAYRIYVWYDRTSDIDQGQPVGTQSLGTTTGAAVYYLPNIMTGTTGPVVPGTLILELQTGTPPTWGGSPAYTLDEQTGKITFTTAPAAGTPIRAREYRVYPQFTPVASTANLAVYGSDQADAMNLKQQLDVLIMGTTGTPYNGYAGFMNGVNENVRQRLAEAEQKVLLGDQSYKAGDFTTAKVSYTDAMTLLDKAKEQDADVSKQNLNVPSIAVWVAGFGVLIFGLGVMVFAFKWKVKE